MSQVRRLLGVAPDLGKANFVESVAEDLADAVHQLAGPDHRSAKPRHALNTFQWQLPETMPLDGGPDVMAVEEHSISRIMTGCFYDVIRNMFLAEQSHDQAKLLTVTRRAARLFYEAALNAPRGGRFFRSIGRAMVLADAASHRGDNRQHVEKAFARHNIILGTAPSRRTFLAPELALRGAPPLIDREAGEATVQPETITDLRQHVGARTRAAVDVHLLELADTPVASVDIHDEVALDDVDKRLAGIIAPINKLALVGESGGSPALLFAPRARSAEAEVRHFVKSLVRNNKVAFEPLPRRRALIARKLAPGITHGIRKHANKYELYRIRFACGA